MEDPMRILSYLAVLFLSFGLEARTSRDYLPPDADLDPVPPPESVLGWEVGDWHVSHDKLVAYMQALAAASPRVSIKVIGHTHEQRPLLQLAITSSANQPRLEALREAHLEGEGPLVIWLGYSVHGDEPSGSNASLLAAYYLAASRSGFVTELLDGAVVLIDPSFNPDGLDRFASWANSNAGHVPVADPVTRQHVQNWPEGRTNHYWFDLNRDWLPLVHPESRARVAEYHRWLPHVLTDHHEQDSHPGFFFQPGVPSRQHPLTPAANLELTRALAAYHAESLDEAGQPYFSEDAYDDFYFGKGSTYPDINGTIGILFEQRAILGQELSTGNGVETFRMAIANHLRMSLSTLRGSWAMRDRLKAYQAGFHQAMIERAADRRFEAWLVGDDGDPARAAAFLELLDLHRIDYLPLGETVRAGGREFVPGHAWVLPARQRQFGLLEALMEQRRQFADNTFYDVSAWTLPLAFNLPFTTLDRVPRQVGGLSSPSTTRPDAAARAWAVPWNQLAAAPLLQRLLDAGVRVRTAMRPFSISSETGMLALPAGTLVVQSGIQDGPVREQAVRLLAEAADAGLTVHNLATTLTASGPDLGSRHFRLVEPIRPLLIGGEGTSPYGVGEQWHLLDRRLGVATPIVDPRRLPGVDLQAYSHLLLADGDPGPFDETLHTEIARWVRQGGILLAVGRAANWAEALCFENDPALCGPDGGGTNGPPPDPVTGPPASRAYSQFERDKAEQVIGGAIVAGLLDLSHPLAFGYPRPELPLFRRGTVELLPSGNPYSTPVRYAQEPLLAGFIGRERLDALPGAPAVIAEKQGQGLVVRFANTPLFRGFWRGTERLFVNALYFGQVVESTDLPEAAPAQPETLRREDRT
jgi:hypothetical protein